MITATPLARLLMVAAAAACAYGYFYASLFPPLMGSIVLLYLLYERILFARVLREAPVAVMRDVAGIPFAKEPTDIFVRCTNTSSAALRMRLSDGVPDGITVVVDGSSEDVVRPGEEAVAGYVASVSRRGTYRWRGATLYRHDLNRLYCSELFVEAPSERYVNDTRDAIRNAERIAAKASVEGLPLTQLGRPEGDEYEGIRDYDPADRPSQIDWKSVSRLQTLVSKLLESEDVSSFTFMVDCAPPMRTAYGEASSLNYAVLLVMQVAKILLLHGQSVGLVSHDEVRVVDAVSPGKGDAQYASILSSLSRLPGTLDVEDALARPYGAPVEDGASFLQTLAPFLHGTRRGAGAEDAFSRIAGAVAAKAHVIVLTDLLSDPGRMVRAVARANREAVMVTVIVPYLPWFSRSIDDLSKEEASRYYAQYVERRRHLVRLRAMPHVAVIEGSPYDHAEYVYKRIGRRSA
ncbi:MAG: DUF58 domain-containing protein [Candidatus Methanofastidiosa archaeon]|nr:DUF58 domain-containing protein [Candidatus Methanofastidiosa archaeon]